MTIVLVMTAVAAVGSFVVGAALAYYVVGPFLSELAKVRRCRRFLRTLSPERRAQLEQPPLEALQAIAREHREVERRYTAKMTVRSTSE